MDQSKWSSLSHDSTSKQYFLCMANLRSLTWFEDTKEDIWGQMDLVQQQKFTDLYILLFCINTGD